MVIKLSFLFSKDRTVELAECEEIIKRCEPSPEAREQGVMLVDGEYTQIPGYVI